MSKSRKDTRRNDSDANWKQRQQKRDEKRYVRQKSKDYRDVKDKWD